MFSVTACAHKRTCAQAEELRGTALSALLSLAVNPDCSCRKQVGRDGSDPTAPTRTPVSSYGRGLCGAITAQHYLFSVGENKGEVLINY